MCNFQNVIIKKLPKQIPITEAHMIKMIMYADLNTIYVKTCLRNFNLRIFNVPQEL